MPGLPPSFSPCIAYGVDLVLIGCYMREIMDAKHQYIWIFFFIIEEHKMNW